MNNLEYSNLEASLDFKFKNALKKHRNGEILLAQGDYYFILQNSPRHYKALNLLSETYFQQNNFKKSKQLLEESLSIQHDVFDTLYKLAFCLMKLDELNEALVYYKQCIYLQPKNFILYADIALTYKKLKKFDEAIENYNISISINPTLDKLYNNRGNVFLDLKNYSKAIIDYKKAIEINPNYYQCLTNLGNSFLKLNLIDEAEKTLEKSIFLNNFYADSHLSMGMIKVVRNNLDEGISDFNKAISIDNNNAQYYMNKSMALLLKGEFTEGWKFYEWRLKLPNRTDISKLNDKQRWHGKKNLENKTILLICEQGLGDTIQFARYAKLLFNKKTKIIMEVQKPLINFFRQLEPEIKIISKGEKVNFDYYCPLLSLPYVLNLNDPNIPKTKYLTPNIKIVKKLEKNNLNKKMKIGFAFSGNNNHENTLNRDINFKEISKIISDDYQFFCIQKDISEKDLFDMKENQKVIWPVNYLSEDFSNTAALISTMDLIITVDTSLVHLSGSMGIKTWLLIPYNNDWRWMKNITYSPWYPSVKIFRQSKLGIWDDVIDKVKDCLK